ncbi:hypothetical protein G7Z17_g5560 [Cylindrodendrum hubeiense]|uniref:Choloylglycine hydrolase/NAAA C-terminal domain-containing protein n=1 Tax=Cylindrodendrum hubeiense TaxID=595255 RepID=A0A9P5LH77_9HYPO|nr:hypothetical protein G7Z17_g5560 [Cylindrodendrum hubeiense]
MHNSSLAVAASLLGAVIACSRVTYKAGVNNRITIGRSMDFFTLPNTTIWAFPAALRRFGGVSDNPFTWTSRYGSVSAVVLDQIYTEGINTEGLTGSSIYLENTDYGERVEIRPGMFAGIWMQYFLDMYASVAEAASDYCHGEGGKEKFQVVGLSLLQDHPMSLHLSFSDTKGDNLILEFVKGKLKCHHSRKYNVVTDEPSFDKQLAIDSYWSPISKYSLPGTSLAADRFARLSHYNRLIPRAPDLETAVSFTAGMIRAVSTPIKYVESEDEENDGPAEVWPTLWRMFTDTLDKIVFYESATSPMNFWYNVNELNLTKGATVTMLSLVDVPWRKRVGDVTDKFEPVPDNECIWTAC